MDRRVTKTKLLLKNSFIELMNTTNINKISITDLTEKADINRGTFYLHYSDIENMIESFENEAIQDINDIIENNVEHITEKEYFFPILEVTTYAKQNKDFFKNMFGPNGDINFIKRIKESMLKVFYKYASPAFTEIEDPIIMACVGSIIISGGVGAFEDWINTGCYYSASKILRELEFLIKKHVK